RPPPAPRCISPAMAVGFTSDRHYHFSFSPKPPFHPVAVDLAGPELRGREARMIGRIGPVLRLERDRAEAPQCLALLALECRAVMGCRIELQSGRGGPQLEFAPAGCDACCMMENMALAFEAEIAVEALIVHEGFIEQDRLAEIKIGA